jgi:hypothetical protein
MDELIESNEAVTIAVELFWIFQRRPLFPIQFSIAIAVVKIQRSLGLPPDLFLCRRLRLSWTFSARRAAGHRAAETTRSELTLSAALTFVAEAAGGRTFAVTKPATSARSVGRFARFGARVAFAARGLIALAWIAAAGLIRLGWAVGSFILGRNVCRERYRQSDSREGNRNSD